MAKSQLIIDILLNAPDNQLQDIAKKTRDILSKIRPELEFDENHFLDSISHLKNVLKNSKFELPTDLFDKISSRLANLGLVFNGLQSAAQSLQDISRPFVALDTATQRIKTLGGEARSLAEDFRSLSLEMSQKVPIAANELQNAIYEALSAGIRADKSEIQAFIESASQLATGGMVSIGDAVNQLSSLLNAYGESAQKTQQYADDLFTTVNLGKTTVAELNSSLSYVIPTAAAAGVSFRNIGASLALMTANGIPTNQAATRLNQLLIELQKPGDQLAKILQKAGVSLDSLRNESLPENLSRIRKALEDVGLTATQAFSSSEASAAFNVLTKDVARFQDTLSQFQNSAGATRSAFEDMSQSIENRSKLMQVQFESFLINSLSKLGDFGAGLITATNILSSMTPYITSLAALKSLIPPSAISGIGNLARSLLSSLVPSLAAATSAQATLNATILANPYVLAAAGVATLAVGIAGLVSWLHKSTEEKIEDARAEQELIDRQIESNQKMQEAIQHKIQLVEQFRHEGAEAMNNTKLLLELAQAYPGVINLSLSYQENLQRLETQSANSRQQLEQFSNSLDQLAQKKIEIGIELKILSIEQAKEKIEDAIGPSFWESLFLSIPEIMERNQLGEQISQSILQATNPEELERAFVDAQLKIYNSQLSNEKKQEAIRALEELRNAQLKVLTEMKKDFDNLVSHGMSASDAVALLAKKTGIPWQKVQEIIRYIRNQEQIQQQNEQKTQAVTQKSTKAIESKKKATEDLYSAIRRLVQAENQRADAEIRSLQLAQNRLLVEQKRQKNSADDLTLALRSLEIQKQKNQKILEYYAQQKLIIRDGENWVINPKARLKEDQKNDLENELARLRNEIENSEINVLQLRAKLEIDAEELQRKIQELEISRLEFQLETDPFSDAFGKLENIYSLSLEKFRSTIEENKRIILELEQNFASQTNEFQKTQIQAQILALRSQNQELEKNFFDSQSKFLSLLDKFYQNQIEISKNFYQKDEENLRNSFDQKIQTLQKFSDSFLRASQNYYDNLLKRSQNQFDQNIENQKKNLENLKDFALLSQSSFDESVRKLEEKNENERLRLEENIRRARLRSEALFQGQMRELQRQQALETAKIQQQNVLNEIQILEEKQKKLQQLGRSLSFADQKRLEELRIQFDQLNQTILEKSNSLNEALAVASEGISQAITNLFAADPSAAVDSIRSTFSQIFGIFIKIIEKEISAVVIKTVLNWLNYDPSSQTLPFWVKIGLIPIMQATISGALNAIARPILNSLLSFSTGGRIEQPTLAIVGDASRLGSRNREWIFSDPQLLDTIRMATLPISQSLLNELRSLRLLLASQTLETRLSGSDILISLRRTQLSNSFRSI